MSKVQTDNLESYSTGGAVNVLSSLVVASNKTLRAEGATDLNGGVTVDGQNDSLVVGSGDVFINPGEVKVGGTTSSPAARIDSSGAASFQTLTVGGVSIPQGSSGGDISFVGRAVIEFRSPFQTGLPPDPTIDGNLTFESRSVNTPQGNQAFVGDAVFKVTSSENSDTHFFLGIAEPVVSFFENLAIPNVVVQAGAAGNPGDVRMLVGLHRPDAVSTTVVVFLFAVKK